MWKNSNVLCVFLRGWGWVIAGLWQWPRALSFLLSAWLSYTQLHVLFVVSGFAILILNLYFNTWIISTTICKFYHRPLSLITYRDDFCLSLLTLGTQSNPGSLLAPLLFSGEEQPLAVVFFWWELGGCIKETRSGRQPWWWLPPLLLDIVSLPGQLSTQSAFIQGSY